MSAEGQDLAIQEVSFKEAVGLVGRKPNGAERKDLITLWGFTKKYWRWCIDVSIPLEKAIEIHRKLQEEIKTVGGKKKK